MTENTFATNREIRIAKFVILAAVMILFLMPVFFDKVNMMNEEEKKNELKKLYPNIFLGKGIIFIPLNMEDVSLIDGVVDNVNMFCPQYSLGQISENGVWFFIR